MRRYEIVGSRTTKIGVKTKELQIEHDFWRKINHFNNYL
jgi:hypothetical protein